MSAEERLARRRLLAQLRAIVARSSSPAAQAFDAATWLAMWLDTPQPTMDGRRPADLLGTTLGMEILERALATLDPNDLR